MSSATAIKEAIQLPNVSVDTKTVHTAHSGTAPSPVSPRLEPRPREPQGKKRETDRKRVLFFSAKCAHLCSLLSNGAFLPLKGFRALYRIRTFPLHV